MTDLLTELGPLGRALAVVFCVGAVAFVLSLLRIRGLWK